MSVLLGPLTSVVTPTMVGSGSEPPTGQGDADWGSGGSRLLSEDVVTAFLLAGEARRRLVARMFGLPIDQTGLVTLIGVGILVRAIHDEPVRVFKAPGVPAAGDAAIGFSLVREAGHLIAGEASRDTPLLVPLVAFAVFGTVVRPVLRLSFRDVKKGSHNTSVMFDRRYGHLVRRNRPRARMPA